MVMPSAPNTFIAGLGDFLRDLGDMGEIVGGDVEQVAGRGLRQHQRMAGRARHDVEEGQRLVVLVDLVAGQFAAQDFGEDVVRVVGRHASLRLVLVLFDQILAERRGRRKLLAGGFHIGALALEIVGDRPAQRRDRRCNARNRW